MDDKEEIGKILNQYWNERRESGVNSVKHGRAHRKAKEYLSQYLEQETLKARADELIRVADYVGLFTKKRSKFVYNVQLPISYLTGRVKEIKAQLTTNKSKEK